MSDDLISRKALLEHIEKSMKENPHQDTKVRQLHNHEHSHFLCMVMKEPVAFDKEKVIEKLKEEGCIIDDEKGNRAVEIIEKGGIE